MRYGFVCTNLLDLRSKPSFRSERVSQLFFGETVEVGLSKDGYCGVTRYDGYEGWVDERFLRPLSRQAFNTALKMINAVVRKSQVKLYDRGGKTVADPYFLYYGTPVSVVRRRQGRATIRLPDDSLMSVRAAGLLSLKQQSKVTGRVLIHEAKKFLGVPYLWGGISSSGFDCSGLIQTICRCYNIFLPRDSKDQINSGRRINKEEIKTGDLLFFPGHVGFAIGRDRIIHASLGSGGVRINGLKPGSTDYRADLDRSFTQARRIL